VIYTCPVCGMFAVPLHPHPSQTGIYLVSQHDIPGEWRNCPRSLGIVTADQVKATTE